MKATRTVWAASVTTMTMVWFVIRYGYDFGTSDQDEFLPYVLHLSNPEWLASDWFVQIQATGFSVRTFFATLLHGISSAGLSIEQSAFVLYVVSWLLLGAGVFGLAHALSDDERVGLLSIPLVLLVTSRWNPGGNDFMYGMLVPESLAWGLVLTGACLLVKGQTRGSASIWTSGLLFGLAIWIHPLVGLQVGAVVFTILLFGCISGGFSRKMLYVWSSLWLIFAIPVVWMFRPGSSPVDARATEILVELRSPHHYLPEAFDASSFMYLLMLAIVSTWVWWNKPLAFRTKRVREVSAFAGGMLFGGLVLSAGIIHVWPEGPLTVLQPFKLAVVLRGLLVVLIVSGFVNALSDTNWLPPARSFMPAALAVSLAVAGVGLILIAFVSPVRLRALPASQPDRVEFRSVATAVRGLTPQNGVIVIPPDWTGFQYASHRAQFVNFKAFPFHSNKVIEWYDRLVLIGRPPGEESAGLGWLAELKQAYSERSEQEWESLLGRINATHAVVPEAISPSNALMCESGWCLIREPMHPLP